jgi:hypothetical protein
MTHGLKQEHKPVIKNPDKLNSERFASIRRKGLSYIIISKLTNIKNTI